MIYKAAKSQKDSERTFFETRFCMVNHNNSVNVVFSVLLFLCYNYLLTLEVKVTHAAVTVFSRPYLHVSNGRAIGMVVVRPSVCNT